MIKQWMRALRGVGGRAVIGAALAAAAISQAHAQVTINTINVPNSIGHVMTATISIDYTRSTSAAATVTVPLPAQLQVNPPAPPAGCVFAAGAVQCEVPAGGPGTTGAITFEVQGAQIGAFNLTATGTGGSSASNPGAVRSSGDLTVAKTRTAPAGTPLGGQTITFRLVPNIGAGGDDVPSGATLTLQDNLPGVLSDFNVTAITASAGITCNSVGAANTARQVTCTINGPRTVAALNAMTVDISGYSSNAGSFANNAQIGTTLATSEPYLDRNDNNNTALLPYTVNPGTDLAAAGSFPLSALVSTPQTLSLSFRNLGPANVPAGGTVSGQVPAGFTVDTVPAGCVYAAPVITCTAGAVAVGGTQSFAIGVTTPATNGAGNITVTVAPPAGFGDANPPNDTFLVPWSVQLPSGDLRITKAKTNGPVAVGGALTSTIGVGNGGITTATYTVGGGAQPLRVVDDMPNEEIYQSASAGWTCSDLGVDSGGAGIRRVVCTRDAGGTLAPGSTITLTISSTVGALAAPTTLTNTACTGKQALNRLGLADADGPQPADLNTANDCASRGTTGTPIVSGEAVVNIVKESSRDNATWLDPVGTPAAIGGNDNTAYWRITFATPSTAAVPNQKVIPTLNLTDNLPGILNLGAAAPVPQHRTPPVTITTVITGAGAGGTCPANLAAGAGNLTCSFTNVQPGTTVTVVIQVQRPFAAGLLTNVASLTSGDAILSGTVTDNAAWQVAGRVDPAVSSKTMVPANTADDPRVGQTVTFTVTSRNFGPSAIATGDMTITDTLDPAKYAITGISSTSSLMNCSFVAATGVVTCVNNSNVNRADVRTVLITARLLKPGVLPPSGPVYAAETNTAAVAVAPAYCEWKDETASGPTLSAACGDAASTSNNTGSVTFDVKLPRIDIQQRKVRQLPAGQTAFGYGDPLSYRMRIQNIGPSRAENVVMTDYLTMPAGFTAGTVTVSAINAVAAEAGFALDATKAASVSCALSSTTSIRCVLDSVLANDFLDPGREVNFLLSVSYTGVSAGVATFGNQAVACADETTAHEAVGACSTSTNAGPTGVNNNTASANDLVFPKADLAITKTTQTPSPVVVNQPVQWVLTLQNNGASGIAQIRASDTLPANFEFITSTVALGPIPAAAMTSAAHTCVPTPASITAAGQVQTIACQLDAVGGTALFPGDTAAGNTVTVVITARPKAPFFTGPYLSNLTNSASVAPGRDGSNQELALDTVPANNTSTSVVQVQRTTIAGRVYADANLDRAHNGGDGNQANVPITLTGTDVFGNSVTLVTTTGVNGTYSFELPPGTYQIAKGVDPAPGLSDFTSNVPGTAPFGSPTAPVSAGTPASGAAGTPASAALITGITLAAGNAATEYNFGEIAGGASISGRVFVDNNNDGLFNGTDVSIPGVTVTLSGVDALGGTVTQALVTDGSGNYAFTGLLPGTYDLTETTQPATALGATLPAGYTTTFAGRTTAGTGGTPGTATAPSVAPSRITGIQVTSGQASVNNWFGELLPSSISGRVFFDAGDDGAFGAGDAALGSVTLTLTGIDDLGNAVNLSTTTGTGGTYTFAGLRPGTYTVQEPTQPTGTADGKTTPGAVPNGGTPGTATPQGTVPSRIQNIVLPPASASTGNDFAEIVDGGSPGSASIAGRVWLDNNKNGVIDGGEQGIDGVTITLSGTNSVGGAVSRTVVTSGGGNYLFASLPAGTYTVAEPQQPAVSNGAVLPAGMTTTLPGITVVGTGGLTQGAASAVTTSPSTIGPIQVGIGNASVNNNFGEIPPSTISGFVYVDVDTNGTRNGEPGINNVTVTLTGTNDLGQAVNATVQTDASGAYRFTNLRPGTYTVTEPNQPPATTNGQTNPGPVPGGGTPGSSTPQTTTPSAIMNLVIVQPGTVSPDNNFGEIGTSPNVVITKLARSASFTENNTGIYDISVRNAGGLPTVGEYTVYDVLPRLTPQVWRITGASGTGWSCTVSPDGLTVACRSSAVMAPGAVNPNTIAVTVDVLANAKAQVSLRNFTLVRGGGEDPAFDPFPGKPVDPTNPASPTDPELRALVPTSPACVDIPGNAVDNHCVRVTPIRFSVALGGRVWLDGTGQKNTYDPGDKDYGGWRVLVVDPDKLPPGGTGIPQAAIERTATTGPNGTYRVDNLIPGKRYFVYFQDPEGRTVFSGPVNGDNRVPQACGLSATGGDGASRNPYLEVNMTEGTVANDLMCPQQSLPIDPNGVVYDALSRAPVPGAVVTFKPEGACPGYDPTLHIVGYAGYGSYDPAGHPMMTVGSDGFYKFLLAAGSPASCLFRLEVTPPPNYTVPSALIPPSGTLQTPVGPGMTFNVQPQVLPPVGNQSTTYYFIVRSGTTHNDIFNNHIPLDPQVLAALRIVKTGSTRVVEIGDSMEYQIGVSQWSGPPLTGVRVTDILPAGFRYIPGTFRIAGTVQPDPTGGVGPTLGFALPNMTAGATVNFTYRVRVGIGSQEGNGTNRARALANNGAQAIASNEAQYTVRVEGGVFTNDGCVIGKVYVDCNNNHMQDPEELGIPGVRLYFDDGFFMVSDSEGKYSVCGRQPRTYVLKVDQTTLPRGSRLTTTSGRNVGDANSLFVDLKNGELQRADFAEGSCSNTVLEQVKARRTRGEVSAPETERKGGPALKFQSRGMEAPKQATDSPNQPFLAPRDRGGAPPPRPLESEHATPVPQLPAGIAPVVPAARPAQ